VKPLTKVFSVIDKFGNRVSLTTERLKHILRRKEMQSQIEKIKLTLKEPHEVRFSTKDPQVLLYYRFFLHTPVNPKYLVVVVKCLNKAGIILTSYFSDRIKKGGIKWVKS